MQRSPDRPATITAAWLREHYACADQVARFEGLYPSGLVVSAPGLLSAAAQGLPISWLARWLEPPARRAYNEALATADRAYAEAVALADRAYDEAIALVLAAAWKEGVVMLPCGCEPTLEGGYGDDGSQSRYSLEWCPMHAKAPEMAALIKQVAWHYEQTQRDGVAQNLSHEIGQAARALLREIRGE